MGALTFTKNIQLAILSSIVSASVSLSPADTLKPSAQSSPEAHGHRVSCPAGDLPNGGGGRAAGAVPRHPKGNRASEIGYRPAGMKEENPAIAGSTGCHRGGVSSTRRKGTAGEENSFRTVRCVRKPVIAGCEKPCQTAGRKENRRILLDSP
jgi:hypothetical protein